MADDDDHDDDSGTPERSHLTAQQRADQDETRRILAAYKHDSGLGDEGIIKLIYQLRETTDSYSAYPEKALVGRYLINRFLRGDTIRPRKERVLRIFLKKEGLLFEEDKPTDVAGIISDMTFKVMSEFWRVNKNNISEFSEVIAGTYTFYAISEEFDDHVVFGAIKFWYDSDDGSLRVTELQKVNPTSHAAERWSGYAFMRRSRVFLMLSAGHRFHTPKVYFLNPYFEEDESTGDDGTRCLDGIMTKLGKRNATLFVSGIHMVPDDDAFAKVQIVPVSSLPPDFPPQIIKNVFRWKT